MSAENDEYPSLPFQDIRKKQRRGRTHGRTNGQTDNVKTVYPPPPQLKFAWGGGEGGRYKYVCHSYCIPSLWALILSFESRQDKNMFVIVTADRPSGIKFFNFRVDRTKICLS